MLKKQALFSQGEPADAVFYLLAGKVKLTVLSSIGKEAVIVILGQGEFFGEACLTGQLVRTASAMALGELTIMRIDKAAMIRILRMSPRSPSRSSPISCLGTSGLKRTWSINSLIPAKSNLLGFCCCLPILGRKARWKNSSFQRFSQETLADKVGTARSQVSFFLNKFRKLGFIDYNGGLRIRSSLLNIVPLD